MVSKELTCISLCNPKRHSPGTHDKLAGTEMFSKNPLSFITVTPIIGRGPNASLRTVAPAVQAITIYVTEVIKMARMVPLGIALLASCANRK
jgi:hypothetical protein